MRIVIIIQNGAQLFFSGAIEQDSARFVEAEDRCSARIDTQADDAQVRRGGEHCVQRFRQRTSFELYNEHITCVRTRSGLERRQSGPGRNELDVRSAGQCCPKDVLAQRRESGESDSDTAQRRSLSFGDPAVSGPP